MKFGTDIDEHEYRFSKHFKNCQLFSLPSYATLKHLHNLSMLLTYIVTLYHIDVPLSSGATRDGCGKYFTCLLYMSPWLPP